MCAQWLFTGGFEPLGGLCTLGRVMVSFRSKDLDSYRSRGRLRACTARCLRSRAHSQEALLSTDTMFQGQAQAMREI